MIAKYLRIIHTNKSWLILIGVQINNKWIEELARIRLKEFLKFNFGVSFGFLVISNSNINLQFNFYNSRDIKI